MNKFVIYIGVAILSIIILVFLIYKFISSIKHYNRHFIFTQLGLELVMFVFINVLFITISVAYFINAYEYKCKVNDYVIYEINDNDEYKYYNDLKGISFKVIVNTEQVYVLFIPEYKSELVPKEEYFEMTEEEFDKNYKDYIVSHEFIRKDSIFE